MIGDCSFCRCRGFLCSGYVMIVIVFCRCRGLVLCSGSSVKMIDDCSFVDVVVFLVFREFC